MTHGWRHRPATRRLGIGLLVLGVSVGCHSADKAPETTLPKLPPPQLQSPTTNPRTPPTYPTIGQVQSSAPRTAGNQSGSTTAADPFSGQPQPNQQPVIGAEPVRNNPAVMAPVPASPVSRQPITPVQPAGLSSGTGLPAVSPAPVDPLPPPVTPPPGLKNPLPPERPTVSGPSAPVAPPTPNPTPPPALPITPVLPPPSVPNP